MKNIFLIIFTFFIGFQSIAQQTINVDDIKVYSFVQQKATPKEGLQHFYKNYIHKFNSAKFPSTTGTLNIKLKFIVEKEGTFSDIQVLNENVEGLGEEAIRVLKTMPAWKPAIHNGKVVRSVFTLPMTIHVNDDKEELLSEKSDNSEANNPTIIKTEYFEFECNRCSIRDTGLFTADYRIESEDKTAEFQVTIMQMPEELSKEMIVMLDENAKYPNATSKDILFLGMTMKEAGFYDEFLQNSYIQMITFYKNGYLFSISAASYEQELAIKLMNVLKQTFKLKI